MQTKTRLTKKERILKNIENDKTIQKYLNGRNYSNSEDFYRQAIRYIKAIEQGRVINNIAKVSSSGMSRTIKFLECAKVGSNKYQYLNFYLFFKCLGYREARNQNDGFSISGCGMDMVFHTNYSNIHALCRLGFISKKKCIKLAQMTPSTM